MLNTPNRLIFVYSGYFISFVSIITLVYFIRVSALSEIEIQTIFQFLTAISLVATYDLNFSKLIIYHENKNLYYGNFFINSLFSIYVIGVFLTAVILFLTVDIILTYNLFEILILVLFGGLSATSSLIFTKIEINDNFVISTLFRNSFSIAPYLSIVIGIVFYFDIYNILLLCVLSRFIILAFVFIYLRIAFNYAGNQKLNYLTILKKENYIILIGILLPLSIYIDRLLASLVLIDYEYNNYILVNEILFKILASAAIASIILIPRLRVVIEQEDKTTLIDIFNFLFSLYLIVGIIFLFGVSYIEKINLFKHFSIDTDFANPLFISYSFAFQLQLFTIIQYVRKNSLFILFSTLIQIFISLISFNFVTSYELNFSYVILSATLANYFFNIYYILIFLKSGFKTLILITLYFSFLFFYNFSSIETVLIIALFMVIIFLFSMSKDYFKIKNLFADIF